MSDKRLIERIDSPYSVSFLGDFSTKLASNTFFNFVGRFWSFVVAILLTPYILSRLTVSEFGVWVLLSVFVGSFALLDLGLGFSFLKFVSEYHAYRDYPRINKVLFSGFVFYTLFGLGVVAIGMVLRAPLFSVFRIETGIDVYGLVLVAFAANNLAMLMLSMLRGLQRMDQSNGVEVAMSVPNVVGTVVFLEAGMGIFGLALNALILSSMTAITGYWRLRRVAPEINLGWNPDVPLTRELFRYGVKLQVGRLGSLICFQVDKLIISRFLGVAAVSFYEVSSRLTLFMRALPLVLISALIPAVSELRARDERARVLKAYTLASKYIVVVAVCLVGFVILEADSLLFLWLGSGFSQSVILVQILAVGYGVNAMSEAASQTGSGVGRPDFDMRGAILLTILNPTLSVVLVQQFGAMGAAVGTTLALTASASYVLWAFHRHYVGISVITLLSEIHLRPWLGCVCGASMIWALHELYPPIVELGILRPLTPVKIGVEFVVYTSTYLGVLVASRHLTNVDWENLRGLLTFGFHFVRRGPSGPLEDGGDVSGYSQHGVKEG